MPMTPAEANKIFAKKAFELAYAVFHIARHIPQRHFSERIEEQAIRLLDAVVNGRYEEAIIISAGFEYFLSLGESVGFVSRQNSEIIIREAKKLEKAIAEFINSNSAKQLEPSLEGIFSETEEAMRRDKAMEGIVEEATVDIVLPESSANDVSQAGHSLFKVAMRHSAILERIRQSGNLPNGKTGCRLKDILGVLPGVSERTLRYDLQKMAERGLIERIGNGGPATYYQTKT